MPAPGNPLLRKQLKRIRGVVCRSGSLSTWPRGGLKWPGLGLTCVGHPQKLESERRTPTAKVRPFSVCSSDTLLACALASVGQFLRLCFFKEGFSFRQEFSFSQSYRFFPSFCQALAEDRVTTPPKKKCADESWWGYFLVPGTKVAHFISLVNVRSGFH